MMRSLKLFVDYILIS